jgi:hypothetical protein
VQPAAKLLESELDRRFQAGSPGSNNERYVLIAVRRLDAVEGQSSHSRQTLGVNFMSRSTSTPTSARLQAATTTERSE